MNMLDAGLSIRSDKDGQPTLVFKTDLREILPPETHEERLEWVRSSFSRFYSRVQEVDFAYQSTISTSLARF
jgi:hypothetical protein